MKESCSEVLEEKCEVTIETNVEEKCQDVQQTLLEEVCTTEYEEECETIEECKGDTATIEPPTAYGAPKVKLASNEKRKTKLHFET